MTHVLLMYPKIRGLPAALWKTVNYVFMCLYSFY